MAARDHSGSLAALGHLCCALLLLMPAAVAAPDASRPVTGAEAMRTGPCGSAVDVSNVVVTDPVEVTSSRKRDGSMTAPPSGSRAAQGDAIAELRNEITLHVEHVQTLLLREQCSPTRARIVLFLDGRPILSANPFPPTDPAADTLKFVLERKESSRDAWTHVLGEPVFGMRNIPVSVGLSDEFPVQSRANLAFRVIPPFWFGVWSIVLLFVAFVFWRLATQSDLLRNAGVQPGDAARKPYSLAKMQAAWWFFLILTSYLFIGLITGDYSTSITPTVLGLMGISAATVIGSATIDNAPAAISAARPAAGPAPSPAARVAITKGRWWLDILSDDNGVNFHRFQMAVWTLVLGMIFVEQVYQSLAMPEFSATLLGLLGISAGTFLGLKTTSEVLPSPSPK